MLADVDDAVAAADVVVAAAAAVVVAAAAVDAAVAENYSIKEEAVDMETNTPFPAGGDLVETMVACIRCREAARSAVAGSAGTDREVAAIAKPDDVASCIAAAQKKVVEAEGRILDKSLAAVVAAVVDNYSTL
jgi:hypothetical protein